MSEKINEYQKLVDELCMERSWGKFHSPKNISTRLTIESAELLEIYNWKTDEESYNLDSQELQNVKDEIGDIFFNLINLCSKHEIDIIECSMGKLEKIREKYKVEKFKNSAKKYNELDS